MEDKEPTVMFPFALIICSALSFSPSVTWGLWDPWNAACQASLSFIVSQGLLKLMSIELVMPSNHLVLCHPLLLLPSIFPSIRIFSNKSALCIFGHSVGTSASASIPPMNIQDWFPLGLTDLISLQSKELSRIFSSTTVWKHQFFGFVVHKDHSVFQEFVYEGKKIYWDIISIYQCTIDQVEHI